MTAPAVVVIPARIASTRLPGKPLADILGRPMIAHVVDRAVEAAVGPVLVACDDPRVARAAEAAGARAVMTDPGLPSGSDRAWAALLAADPDGRHGVVVNLQGDMPSVPPEMVRAAAALLAADAGADLATLAARTDRPEEAADPNIVKMAFEPGAAPDVGRALWFSRHPIPHGAASVLHHIGVYAYRRAALARFVAAPPSALEAQERLEQLRAIALGMRVAAAVVPHAPLGVDAPGQLDAARRQVAALRSP